MLILEELSDSFTNKKPLAELWRTNVKKAHSETAAKHETWSCHLYNQTELQGLPSELVFNRIKGWCIGIAKEQDWQ